MSQAPNETDHPAAEQPERSADSYVQSFARGLAVIRSFDSTRPAQTLSEVASATGLSRAGARRILLTLQALGYVETEGRLFRLTPRILELGFAYLTSMPFWNAAEPVLEGLVEQIHESSSAAVLDRTEIVYVVRVPTRKIMALNLSIGSRLPAYCTSMGRVLLSGLDRRELEERLAASDLRAWTPRTLTRTEDLLREIDRVRSNGWALIEEELEQGLVSLSAPVRNRQGKIIAAVNIGCSSQRKTGKQMLRDFLGPLQEAAHRISEMVALRS